VRPVSGNRSSGFILLEVTVALVILGITAAVSLRSFVLSMHATRELEIAMRASLLAQSMLETFDLVPPPEGRAQGAFGEDPAYGAPYRYYFWKTETEELEIDYDDVSLEGLKREMVPLVQVHLEIYYDDGRNRVFRPIDLQTYVMGFDAWSEQSRRENQYF
jgi:type II secretory pathway pseudopilin PulG